MSIVDKVIEFIRNEINIEITEKNKELIMDKFYPDINDKIYWYAYCDYSGFYEGIIDKEEYENIKTLPQKTNIVFEQISKYKDNECYLNEIKFSDDIDKIKKLIDKGFKKSENYFDLIDYLYE